MDILNLISRDKELFEEDIKDYEKELNSVVKKSSFLVLGGAGSIGSAVVKEIFKRDPKRLFVVDLSENNLAELVRDIRSSFGYISGEFKTFAIDIGSDIFDCFINKYKFDYILNLSALKHVRSEKDSFTLYRMIETNILNTNKTILQAIKQSSKKYFCVSTDKASNPVNLMGASKRIMELFALYQSQFIDISMARFANVAFSDGSLLYSFNKRIEKKQPIVAPTDIKRYFITSKESGELCLMSAVFGENRDIFFPKLDYLDLISFDTIAIKYLNSLGLEPFVCKSEQEAREFFKTKQLNKYYPCYFTTSDTTGEKDFEEFFTQKEIIDWDRFKTIAIIKNNIYKNKEKLNYFLDTINNLKCNFQKKDIVKLFDEMLDNFNHLEKNKYLDEKM